MLKMKTTIHAKSVAILFAFMAISLSGCEDFLVVDPPKDELATQSVFASDEGAEAAMRGIYTDMARSGGVFSRSTGSLSVLGGVLADELSVFFYTSYDGFLSNNIIPDDPIIERIWNDSYNIIYQLNSALEGLSASTGVSDNVKIKLEGEARFLRALCYFYLTNLWGDVPLIETTNYQTALKAPRAEKPTIYSWILTELIEAKKLLPDAFSQGQRTRPTKWAASALLARIYLYAEDWSRAEIESSTVIDNTALFRLNQNLDSCFLKNNSEAVWQAYPSLTLPANTFEGYVFSPLASGYPAGFNLTDDLVASFNDGDRRFDEWLVTVNSFGVDYTLVAKYKINYSNHPPAEEYSEYSVILRLAEQFLIRAEARAHLGKLVGEGSAASDLNRIRSRSGLPNTTASTLDEFVNAILDERRVELFSEWGHRWFDLIRTKKVGDVLGDKPDWNPEDVLWPVPQREIDSNPNMTQNPGYN